MIFLFFFVYFKLFKIKYVREAALIAINILKNLDSTLREDEDEIVRGNSNSLKPEKQNSFYSKNYDMNPPIKEIFERYKNPNLNQNRLSVGKVQTQNIYKKYLSDKKLGCEEMKNISYVNSPSSQYDSNKLASAFNKANSTNGINCEEQRNSSKDNIGQQDLNSLFNKMEIIMIQQNKIYENFINFEAEMKNEIIEVKEKIGKLESCVFGSLPVDEPFVKDTKINNLVNYRTMKNQDLNKSPYQDKEYGIFI